MDRIIYFGWLLLSLGLAPTLPAQVIGRAVIGTAGSTATAGGVQLSATVGEVVSGTALAGTSWLTQGFQQPDVNGAVALTPPALPLQYQLFPNPTAGPIVLTLSSPQPLGIDLDWVDARGRQVPALSRRLQAQPQTQEAWDLSDLAEGTYYLRLRVAGRVLSSLPVQVRR